MADNLGPVGTAKSTVTNLIEVDVYPVWRYNAKTSGHACIGQFSFADDSSPVPIETLSDGTAIVGVALMKNGDEEMHGIALNIPGIQVTSRIEFLEDLEMVQYYAQVSGLDDRGFSTYNLRNYGHHLGGNQHAVEHHSRDRCVTINIRDYHLRLFFKVHTLKEDKPEEDATA